MTAAEARAVLAEKVAAYCGSDETSDAAGMMEAIDAFAAAVRAEAFDEAQKAMASEASGYVADEWDAGYKAGCEFSERWSRQQAKKASGR